MSERMDERNGLGTPEQAAEISSDALVAILQIKRSVKVVYERIAALTAERDALSAVLRQGADAAVDLRTKYEALEKERDQYRALMELACADVIFFHSQEHGPFLQTEEPEYTETIGFSVLVNDLFCPAADAEGFNISEAIPLRDVFRKDGMEGIIRWVQQKRDNLPLRPHVEKRVKEREDLRKENASLAQKLADSELAFAHANEVVGKLEADVARLSAPYEKSDVSVLALILCALHEGIQPPTEADIVAAMNAINSARTAPAKETPCPKCGGIEKVQAGDMAIHECDRCYHCWDATAPANPNKPQPKEHIYDTLPQCSSADNHRPARSNPMDR